MKDLNVPLWLQSVLCLVVRILRQFERQAAWKQAELEHTQTVIQDEHKEVKTDKNIHEVDFRKQTGALGDVPLNLFQTGVGVAGQVCKYTRSQTANSEETPSGMSRHEEAEVQQPAHGN